MDKNIAQKYGNVLRSRKYKQNFRDSFRNKDND